MLYIDNPGTERVCFLLELELGGGRQALFCSSWRLVGYRRVRPFALTLGQFWGFVGTEGGVVFVTPAPPLATTTLFVVPFAPLWFLHAGGRPALRAVSETGTYLNCYGRR